MSWELSRTTEEEEKKKKKKKKKKKRQREKTERHPQVNKSKHYSFPNVRLRALESVEEAGKEVGQRADELCHWNFRDYL